MSSNTYLQHPFDIRIAPLDAEEDFWVMPLLPPGTPVRHRDRPDVVGIVKRTFFEEYQDWVVIDWLTDGFAPQVRRDWVRELPSEMHLLASV